MPVTGRIDLTMVLVAATYPAANYYLALHPWMLSGCAASPVALRAGSRLLAWTAKLGPLSTQLAALGRHLGIGPFFAETCWDV